jgi:hypothetical protein
MIGWFVPSALMTYVNIAAGINQLVDDGAVMISRQRGRRLPPTTLVMLCLRMPTQPHG